MKAYELDFDQYDEASYGIRLLNDSYQEADDLLAEVTLRCDNNSLMNYHTDYSKHSELLADAIHNVISDNKEVQNKIVEEVKKLLIQQKLRV